MWDFVLLSAGWPGNKVSSVRWITEPMVYQLLSRVILKTADLFRNDIIQNAPPASVIKSIEINPAQISGYTTFEITRSNSFDNHITEISPDIAVCDDCLEDMEKDPERIDYPFINCTNCGPRFTIIEGLPYDRENTTMNSFRMCRNCQSEYT